MALTDKLTAIGNAIRGKTGGTDLLTLDGMVTAINGISTGGGTLPPEAYVITGDCDNLFSSGKWKWYIDLFGSQVTTNNITSCNYMFNYSRELTNIPFSINGKSNENYISCNGMFQDCDALLTLPALTIKPYMMSSMFNRAKRIREIPESYATTIDFSRANSYSSSMNSMFTDCYSLRTIPSSFLKQCYSTATSSYNCFYYYAFYGAQCLNEIVGLPIPPVEFTSNIFYYTFNNCHRVKNIIFDTNEDGTAKTANWNNQVIDLTNQVGTIGFDVNIILGYNTGITSDKYVNDANKWLEFKNSNDPDWYTDYTAYSRYDNVSAIASVNSLPDTSAYVAENGGTNVIKFQGEAGSHTGNGAINTMTEEQIAVATAKGWTVTFV